MGKLAFAQQMTEEVPFRYASRLYRNRGAKQIAGDLFRLAALRQSTFPNGGRLGAFPLQVDQSGFVEAIDMENRFEFVEKNGLMQGTRIIVDKETGVNYLFVCRGYGGGLTPLLDADGKPIITKDGYQK